MENANHSHMSSPAFSSARRTATSARAAETSATTPDAPTATEPATDPGWVRKDDILRTVAPVGRDYRFSLSPLAGQAPVLQGEFESLTLRPGLVLQRTRVQDLHDMTTQLTLEPGLKIGLLVEGETEIAYGDLALRLGPRRDAAGRLHVPGSVVALAEPETFRRHWRRGRREAKVSLTLRPEWLAASGCAEGPAMAALQHFCDEHLARHAWTPSARALSLAQQIARPPALTDPFRRWYLEARAVELASEALQSLVQARQAAGGRTGAGTGAWMGPPADGLMEGPTDTWTATSSAAARPPAALPPREQRRLRELLAWIDSRPAATLTLEAIAREAAMSPTALQRAFRAFQGRPLFDHLRERRLDAARLALERDGVSVGQAAEIAGYAGAHNFATAFKRRYGCTPRAWRLRG
jgi:AraC-like DNA-binding protein